MSDPSAIRQKIAAGVLPCERCGVLWAGRGTGRPCSACERPILDDDIEYECGWGDSAVLYFHYKCYVAWDAACRELESGTAVS